MHVAVMTNGQDLPCGTANIGRIISIALLLAAGARLAELRAAIEQSRSSFFGWSAQISLGC